MKQIVQEYRSGGLALEDVPAPVCRPGGVVVRTAYSLISAGTERMKVTQARMGMLQKARSRPDKVKQVIQTVKQRGLLETYRLVQERLNALTPLGYSLAGVVEEVGRGVDEFAVGDRVACAGDKIASHAEFVSVPRNLCVPVPDGVELQDAAFATVGAIAMQGVRQAGVTVGDTVLVIGLGLVGLLAVQILKATGCRVAGVDFDEGRIALAKACGADVALDRNDPSLAGALDELTHGIGADVAYVAASADTADPMVLAGELVRDRGKVVIVGMVKVEADWRIYYAKELSVVMSRSYGPGRYDHNFEDKGIDYPVGYVRWTERRNLEEFLRLIAAGSVALRLLKPLIVPIDQATAVYDQLASGDGRDVAMLFRYPESAPRKHKVALGQGRTMPDTAVATVRVGMIGAGNFATGTLIPALKRIRDVRLRAICSARGLSAKSAANRHGFEYCASDYRELLADDDLDAVVIATHHDTHARFAGEAVRAGKHVFVEKPLALTQEQLKEVVAAHGEACRILMVGYNRRFSPLAAAVRDFFSQDGPIEVVCRVNAGPLGSDSWYQDPEEGGWRIVSEGCHFVDLIQYLCDSPPAWVFADMVGGHIPGRQNDNCVVTLKMANGSLATLIYVANGDPSFEKERIEVFGRGRAAVIENWRRARLVSGGRTKKVRPSRLGKGHSEELAAFVAAVQAGTRPSLTFEDAVRCTLATFAIRDSLNSQRPQDCGILPDPQPR